jgi:hypothetical protein
LDLLGRDLDEQVRTISACPGRCLLSAISRASQTSSAACGAAVAQPTTRREARSITVTILWNQICHIRHDPRCLISTIGRSADLARCGAGGCGNVGETVEQGFYCGVPVVNSGALVIGERHVGKHAL